MIRIVLFLLCISGVAWAETFVSTDVPVNIPDEGTAESYMTIPVNRRIEDVNITLTITHTFDGDLGLYLEAPNGDVVQLAFRLGNSGNNYTNTTFDDEAATPIQNGTPPYTGSFRPSHSLANLDGLGTLGTWTFRVTDNGVGDVGTIDAWQLTMVLGDTLAVPENPFIPHPSSFILSAYPNPFNPVTQIAYSLPTRLHVTLSIFDALGRRVTILRDNTQGPGDFTVPFDGSKLASGAYYCQIRTSQDVSATQRLLLVK